jgi:hypothetical protein
MAVLATMFGKKLLGKAGNAMARKSSKSLRRAVGKQISKKALQNEIKSRASSKMRKIAKSAETNTKGKDSTSEATDPSDNPSSPPKGRKEMRKKSTKSTMFERLQDDVSNIRLLDDDDLEDLGLDQEGRACEAYVLNVPKQDDYEEYDDDVRGALNDVRRGKDVRKDAHRVGLKKALEMGLVSCSEEEGVGSRENVIEREGFDARELFRTYVNERTPWALQKTVLPFWPSDVVRNLKRWFVFWLLWWAFGIKKKLGKSLSNTLRRFLVYALLFRMYTRRLARDAE